MTPPERRAQLQDLYRMSSYHTAEVLLWALRVVDDHEPHEWGQEIKRRGGPAESRTASTLKRLGVQGV